MLPYSPLTITGLHHRLDMLGQVTRIWERSNDLWRKQIKLLELDAERQALLARVTDIAA